MGNSNSGEKFILKMHETMANLVRDGCDLMDLEKAANATAELIIADGDKKTDVNLKTLIRNFVDPITKLNLLHLICYGDYLVLRDPSKDKKRLELLKQVVADDKICDHVNCVDAASGRNALHFACARPLPHPGDFADVNNTELVRFLLVEGVSFDLRDNNGVTPLMLAADRMFLGSIKELVGRGARVDAVDKSGLNVFHHFVLAYGNRSCHSRIPLNDLVPTLETLTAVASSQARNLALSNFVNSCGAAVRAYYDGGENVSRKGENRVKPMEEFSYTKNNFLPFTPLLIAISCFILEDAEATTLKSGRAAIVSHLIRNGFSFYEPTAFFHAFGHCPFSAKDPFGGSQQSLVSHDDGTSHLEAKFDFALHRQGIAAFLARLHRDDAAILQLDEYSNISSVLQFPRGVLLTSTRAFVPQIFADDADRDALARSNSLIASIIFTHFGIFSYLLKEGGFSILLKPVGSRCVTPLHVLLGIRILDDNSHEPLHKYFVDRCLEFAFKLASEEKYFEQANPNFDLALLVAVDASNPAKKFSPINTRADLAKFADTLASFFASPGSAVLPTRDSFKFSPLVTSLANLRPVTLTSIIPQCAQLQSAFFKSPCRQLVQRVFISPAEAQGTLKRLLAKDGIFPNATQLQIQGVNNTTSSDMVWIAEDESVKFTSIEFVECTVDLQAIARSRKLNESLERLALIRCQGIGKENLEELARVDWSKEFKLIVEGGGNEMKANVAAVNNVRVGVTGLPFRCVYYPDLAKSGLD